MDAELLPMVVFERHPASIDRHTEPGPGYAEGFDGIVTWLPHVLDGDGEVLERDVEPAPPAPQELPPGYRPPPVPVRPAALELRPDPVPQEPDTLADMPDVEAAETIQPPEPESPAPVVEMVAEPAVVSSPLPARDPFAILKSGPSRNDPLVWPGSSPLVRPSVPEREAFDPLWEDAAPVSRRDVRRPSLLQFVMGLGLVAALAGLGLAAVRYGPALLGPGETVTAVFNAPMMVVRSAAAGRVVTVAATAAQVVDPQSPLLTLRTNQDSQDRAILAGVHGMIRSVETVPGAALVAGAPLVRLQDCDRAFLTIPSGTMLKAGQTVQVKLPDQKPVAGKVRLSAGVMEPPDSLVIEVEPGVLTASCPVGHSAIVTPAAG